MRVQCFPLTEIGGCLFGVFFSFIMSFKRKRLAFESPWKVLEICLPNPEWIQHNVLTSGRLVRWVEVIGSKDQMSGFDWLKRSNEIMSGFDWLKRSDEWIWLAQKIRWVDLSGSEGQMIGFDWLKRSDEYFSLLWPPTSCVSDCVCVWVCVHVCVWVCTYVCGVCVFVFDNDRHNASCYCTRTQQQKKKMSYLSLNSVQILCWALVPPFLLLGQDKHEFVIKRMHQLAKVGVTNALVALSNTESKNSRELLCRVFLALATEESLRGLLVQQGAVKVSHHVAASLSSIVWVWGGGYLWRGEKYVWRVRAGSVVAALLSSVCGGVGWICVWERERRGGGGVCVKSPGRVSWCAGSHQSESSCCSIIVFSVCVWVGVWVGVRERERWGSGLGKSGSVYEC